MKQIRKIIEIDEKICDGCGNCVLACAEGAIDIINGKAKVIGDQYCDGLGACIGDCPQGALKIIERQADAFDEKAVEQLLSKQKENKASFPAFSCPSSAMKTFPMENLISDNKQEKQNDGLSDSRVKSYLGHWPVQIRLVPSNAPFLKNADLVVAADCVSVVYPNFHQDFLNNKAIMIGCPKFDNNDEAIEKFYSIFVESKIKSITCVIMQVPCCSVLPLIIRKAYEKSKTDILFREIIISVKGQILLEK